MALKSSFEFGTTECGASLATTSCRCSFSFWHIEPSCFQNRGAVFKTGELFVGSCFESRTCPWCCLGRPKVLPLAAACFSCCYLLADCAVLLALVPSLSHLNAPFLSPSRPLTCCFCFCFCFSLCSPSRPPAVPLALSPSHPSFRPRGVPLACCFCFC